MTKQNTKSISFKCWNLPYTSICGNRFFSYITPTYLCANKYTHSMIYIYLDTKLKKLTNYFYIICNSYLAQLNQLKKPIYLPVNRMFFPRQRKQHLTSACQHDMLVFLSSRHQYRIASIRHVSPTHCSVSL